MFCSKVEADEAIKLNNQDEIKRFYLFSYHVYHLRDLLKCSICMELYNYPVELTCKHVFCKECIKCYLEYAGKEELGCPICQIPLIVNSEHHNFLDKVTIFVKYALEDVNTILGSDLNKLPSYAKIFELWQRNKKSSTIFSNLKSKTILSSSVPDYSVILKAKQAVVRSNAKYVTPDKEGHDPFDALGSSGLENNIFKQNRRTYVNRKLENSKSCADKFQKLNDDVNKADILNWLEDTRNKFDLIPITQQQIREEIPEFDLPSISQYGRQRVTRSRPQGTKPDAVTEEKHKTEDERRSPSLEDSKKIENSKPKLKRHNVATYQLEDEIVIEQVNSEEDSKKTAIVNLMEDKCLDAIDKEVLLENKILSETVELNKRSSLRSSTDSSRGWNRMREIKKTIGHGRKKGKLKVISSSSSTNLSNDLSKKDKPVNKIKRKAKELPTRILEIDEDSDDKKTFDLNVLEAYFSNNLSKAIAAGITEEPYCSKAREIEDNVHEAVVNEEVSIQHNGTKQNQNEQEVVSEDVIPNSINPEIIQACSLNNIYDNMLTIRGMKNSPTVEEPMISNKLNFEDDDDIFTLATQETSKTDKFTKQLLLVRNIVNKREDAEVILNKLQDFLMHDKKDVKVVSIQTEDLKDTCALFSSVSTQTNGSRGKEIAVQTDSCDQFTGFRISSTDMFQIQPVINSTAQTDPLICRNCKVDVSKHDKNSQVHKVTENFALTGSFDNFTFETQDVIKGQKISIDNEKTERVSSVKVICQGRAEVENSVDDTDLLKNGIQTPVQAQSLKRIRTESDSENNKSHPTKKNRYVNDISVVFLSESDGDQSEKEVPKLNANDDNIRIEPIPKRLKTQDIIKECEQIIKEACSSTLRIEQTQCLPEIQKPLTLLEKFNRNSELNEDPMHEDKTHKKFSESLFTSAEHLKDSELELINNNHQTNKPSVNDIIHQFKEIQDSFEDDYNAEVESITEQILRNDRSPQRIQILQHVTLGKNIEYELETGGNYNKSADMFDSDVEIVETTPQKNRPKGLEIASQTSSNHKAKMKLVLGDEFTENDALDVLSCFNKTFTPPPEFQDFIDNTSNPICAEKENVPFSSLSSDLLENECINKSSTFDRDVFITSTPFPSTSQVLSSRSINLSPIHNTSKQMNPILAVQSAGKLPLTITGNETPRRQRMNQSNITTPKQKTILNYVKPGGDLNSSSKLSQTVFEKPLSLPTKPKVACTRLDKKEMSLLVALANKNIITFTTTFSSTVTHMIVTVDKFNCLVDHTMKFVSAVAAGIWVLNIHWIEECLKQYKVVPEEDYEALDVSGIDGPRRSRLNRSKNPLLKNYVIYAAPPFKSVTQKEVENVILLLGGDIVKRPDELTNNNGKICLIITESSQSQSDQIYENWLETLKVITVELEWLSRSVGKFEPLSLKPFAMWYEESMTHLAYPSALLEDVPYSTYNTLT